MMRWIVVILSIYIVQLKAILPFEVCPAFQYLNSSGICVQCTQCHDSKNTVIRPCSSHADSVCGTIVDLETVIPGAVQSIENKKTKSEPTKQKTLKNSLRKTASRNPLIVKQAKKDYEDRDYNEYESSTGKPVKKNTSKSAKVKKIKNKSSSDLTNKLNEDIDLVSAKLKGNKSSKHIKKDLSQEGVASIGYAVKSKVGEITKNSVMPKVSLKLKTSSVNTNEHASIIKGTQFLFNVTEVNASMKDGSEWPHLIHPHVEKHHIYLEMDNENVLPEKENARMPVKESSNEMSSDKMLMSIEESDHINKTNFGDIIKYDDYDAEQVNNKNINNSDNNVEEDKDDDDDDNDDDDDDEDDDGGDSDDYDSDDDDNDNDEEEDDEFDEEDDTGTDEEHYTIRRNKPNNEYLRFGIANSPRRSEIIDEEEDDDYDDDDYDPRNDNTRKSVMYAPSESDVNVEPFAPNSNWQLVILVSAASACLLFFVVVNAYICIYMKKWKHMKQDFEADVEDLSVRINLMQHAGFEAEETTNMKNYITQFKNGKKCNN